MIAIDFTVTLALAQASLNVFELRGPQFLAFYLWLLGFAVVAAFVLRQVLRTPSDPPSLRTTSQLDAYEIAYLAGKRFGAVDAAIAGLVHRGIFDVDRLTQRVKCVGELTPRAHLLEQAVYEAVGATSIRIANLRTHTYLAMEHIRHRLRDAGLISPPIHPTAQPVPGVVTLAVGLVGLAKILVGLSRGRPVSILLLFVIATAVITALFWFVPVHRTRRGDAALEELKRRNAGLRLTATAKPEMLGAPDVAVALALFGPSIALAGTEALSDLRVALRRAQQSSGGSSGCGSGGSSCGSSGCGGGGGCGGGCGGCGS